MHACASMMRQCGIENIDSSSCVAEPLISGLPPLSHGGGAEPAAFEVDVSAARWQCSNGVTAPTMAAIASLREAPMGRLQALRFGWPVT